MTRDPIKDGRNWYSYCGNNPVISYDAEGLREVTQSDRDRLNRLRKHGIDSGFSAEYMDKVILELVQEILAVEGSDPARLRALWWAIDQLGNTSYGFDGDAGGDYKSGTNKCNKFVFDAYTKGASIKFPQRKRWGGLGPKAGPHGAKHWADRGNQRDFPGFAPTNYPKPGDIMAFGSDGKHGHMALVIGNGLLIYAGSDDVKLGTYEANRKNKTGWVGWSWLEKGR